MVRFILHQVYLRYRMVRVDGLIYEKPVSEANNHISPPAPEKEDNQSINANIKKYRAGLLLMFFGSSVAIVILICTFIFFDVVHSFGLMTLILVCLIGFLTMWAYLCLKVSIFLNKKKNRL